jgi:hypothetical protein
MRIRLLAGAVALGAVVASSVPAATPSAYLRSASASGRHVVVVYNLRQPDLAPGRILVATRPRTAPGGQFVKANIRLNEQLSGTRSGTGMRMRTRHTLRPGNYYVEISGIVIGLDCTPKKPCKPVWSNVRRVSVR